MLLGNSLKSQSQILHKRNIYIYFKNDSINKIAKRHFFIKTPKSEKKFELELYDYFYTAEQMRHYQFVSKQTFVPQIVDTNYIKLIKPKSVIWLKNLKEPLPSTFYKDFPYKKIFLVEKLESNRYKISQIESFMGKDF